MPSAHLLPSHVTVSQSHPAALRTRTQPQRRHRPSCRDHPTLRVEGEEGDSVKSVRRLGEVYRQVPRPPLDLCRRVFAFVPPGCIRLRPLHSPVISQSAFGWISFSPPGTHARGCPSVLFVEGSLGLFTQSQSVTGIIGSD